MKTVNWENPERSLELQPGDQPANSLYDLLTYYVIRLDRAILRAFPKPVDWNKIQACTPKSDKSLRDHYSQLQIILKEYSGLSADVDSTWGSF